MKRIADCGLRIADWRAMSVALAVALSVVGLARPEVGKVGQSLVNWTTTNTAGGTLLTNCEGAVVVRWSNVPPAVVVQYSTNLSNWMDVLLISKPPGSPVGFQTVEFPATNANATTGFFRLREIEPVPCPPE